MSAPILMTWQGDGFTPLGVTWAKRADQQYTVGERYMVSIVEERSLASHNHYFAALAEAHANLPERYAEQFPTVEHLRKYALIRTGYRDERSIVCPSKAAAQRFAAFCRPMDDFAIISVSESVVIAWTAKSQSFRAMGKKAFGESKDAVLSYIAEMIGTTPEALNRERAA
jgi:hypothetical protein